MANFINLTPHSIEIYGAEQFVGLEQVNPTSWIADGVVGEPIASFTSEGSARISTQTEEHRYSDFPGITAKTSYGEAVGIPTVVKVDTTLIVSLPMQAMAKASGHPYASQMVAPYKVVRSRENGSLVIGCMGFTF